jgi:hypothetical protein
MKKQQVQLYCGRFVSTSSAVGSRNVPVTDDEMQVILQNWKKYETTINWALVDCKQNV